MFKFGTIGMFQHAKNNPRVVATDEIKNGYAFKIVDGADGETTAPFADAAEAKKAQVWVAMNIIDKPELDNSADYKVAIGEYVNAFALNDLIGYPVEISSDLVTTAYASVAKDDILIPIPSGTDEMKWAKGDPVTDTGYGVILKVVEKTTFGGKGFYCKIASN